MNVLYRLLLRSMMAAAVVLAVTGAPASAQDSAGAEVASASLVAAAIERTRHRVVYDGSYRRLAYPGGDVPADRGVCTDLVIRAYRAALGIDLQQRVHEDMTRAFASYPPLWGLSRPDSNIDHRRVPNLETFLKRQGAALAASRDAQDYAPGDLVTWRLAGTSLPHIGIVTDRMAPSGNPLIAHNIGRGPELGDMLFDHPITGHFRYLPAP